MNPGAMASQPASASCRPSPARRRLTRLRRDTRGSATAELVLSISILILLLWFLVYCGRLADTRLRIEDVAHQAARAASLARTSANAAADARSTAAAALDDAGVACRTFNVATSGSLQPGSSVTVTVSCAADLGDLAMLQVPGTVTLTARFTSPVDAYRGRALTLASSGVPWSRHRSAGAEQ